MNESSSFLEEREKARRELEQAQAGHERGVREDEAKKRERQAVPIHRTYRVTADVFVRQGPSDAFTALRRLPKDTKVYVVGVRDDWLEIQSKHGRPPGYIEKKYAELVGGEAEKLSLRRCLAQAEASYLADWNKTCANQGRPGGCTLAASGAALLDQRHRTARDECFRLHPQR